MQDKLENKMKTYLFCLKTCDQKATKQTNRQTDGQIYKKKLKPRE